MGSEVLAGLIVHPLSDAKELFEGYRRLVAQAPDDLYVWVVDATAYPHRDVQFVMNVHTRWADAAKDETRIAWARQFFEEATPYATGGVYVNFMPADEAQRVRSGAYGGNYDRLAQVKRKYDARNLFRMNHNIQPAP